MTHPIFDTRSAVDLADLNALSRLRETSERERAKSDAEQRILRWDAAMTRAFKGIFPRSTRLAFMKREHARLSRG